MDVLEYDRPTPRRPRVGRDQVVERKKGVAITPLFAPKKVQAAKT